MNDQSPNPKMKRRPVIVWGTYDLGKPRVRILLNAAQQVGIELYTVHSDIWRGVEDKSRISGRWRQFVYLLRWLLTYPGLVFRYLKSPKHDFVFIPYMGHVDVVVLRAFASMRGAQIIWDAMLSIHGTVVEDRKLIKPDSIFARLIRAWDRLALRCADRIITATQARARQYNDEYGIDLKDITPVLLGVELENFRRPKHQKTNAIADRPMVLFYGQFSPLHGLATVIDAARSPIGSEFDWTFIGTGQEGWQIEKWIQNEPTKHVRWIEWIPYDELADWIQRADLCLGHFGSSLKAASSIPNKVFQIIASGRPLITRDSLAMRELLEPEMPGIYLVPPADSESLVEALVEVHHDLGMLRCQRLYEMVVPRCEPASRGKQLQEIIESMKKPISQRKMMT